VSELQITGSAQRAAWLDRVMPPVEQLDSRLWSIPVILPHNPLRYTTVYALCDDSGVALLDAGWDSDESWQMLVDGLAQLGATVSDVYGVLVTHQHFDHIGLARRVREASSAWVAMHPADRDAIARPDFRLRALAERAEVDRYRRMGAPLEVARRLRARATLDRDTAFVLPDRLLEDGDDAAVRGWSLRAVHTPGHTPGHLAFHDEASDLLFAGDTLLPRISPNVSATQDADWDALGDFLETLESLTVYDSAEVLPAHEWRFRGVKARVEELADHHERRLAELLEAVHLAPDCVPWDLAGQLTWSRPWDQYDGSMLISAVSETMAHLVRLQRLGLVVASGGDVPRYRAAGHRFRTLS
jgi:glyoxylase-like metal-dependent hydrolase (beta-lactamase superfamily II)